jgi:hypothetical protein
VLGHVYLPQARISENNSKRNLNSRCNHQNTTNGLGRMIIIAIIDPPSLSTIPSTPQNTDAPPARARIINETYCDAF